MRILLAAAALLAAAPALGKPATPEQLERQTWTAFKAGRASEFKAMFAPNFVGIYADGSHDLAREMQVLNHVRIERYRLSDMVSHAVDEDDVLLTYTADVQDRVDGKPIRDRLQTASLWHRNGGRWLCVYHTEIRAK